MSEADLSLRIVGPTAGPDRPARIAIAAAVLLHLFIAWLLLFGWRESAAPEPQTIQVTLLTLPPPAPPAPTPAPPAPTEPQKQKQLSARESGPDQETTAAPQAATPSPETEAPPPASQSSATQKPAETPPQASGLEAPPAEKPKAPETPRTEPKPKLALRAPEVAPPIDRVIGDKDETGDPYLNALWSRIERNRAPTTPVGPEGLHLEGITVFAMLLDHSGRVQALDLISSSGSALLDNEARRMIVAATPFPTAPDDYPDRIPLRITIHLYPQ